jgi:hypothetical protein
MPVLPRPHLLRRLRSAVLLRPAGRAGLLATATIFLGCMSFTIDRSERGPSVVPVAGGQLLEQQGEAAIPAGQAVDVYYPVPHSSPPNLTLDEDFGTVFDRCALVAQQPDHFRVRNDGVFERKVHWKSKGMTVSLTPLAPPSSPAPPPPAPPTGPTLPAEPVPVEPKANP